MQVLKDKMRKPVVRAPLSDVDLDAETEDGSTDGIPDDFFGVKDEPKYEGSEPPLSQPNPALALQEALEEHIDLLEVRGFEKGFCYV